MTLIKLTLLCNHHHCFQIFPSLLANSPQPLFSYSLICIINFLPLWILYTISLDKWRYSELQGVCQAGFIHKLVWLFYYICKVRIHRQWVENRLEFPCQVSQIDWEWLGGLCGRMRHNLLVMSVGHKWSMWWLGSHPDKHCLQCEFLRIFGTIWMLSIISHLVNCVPVTPPFSLILFYEIKHIYLKHITNKIYIRYTYTIQQFLQSEHVWYHPPGQEIEHD